MAQRRVQVVAEQTVLRWLDPVAERVVYAKLGTNNSQNRLGSASSESIHAPQFKAPGRAVASNDIGGGRVFGTRATQAARWHTLAQYGGHLGAVTAVWASARVSGGWMGGRRRNESEEGCVFVDANDNDDG